MTLLVKNPAMKEKGWEGFHYIINRSGDDSVASVEFSADNWNWKRVGNCRMAVCKNALMFTVPRKLIGIEEYTKNFSLEFKWADNTPESDLMAMYTDGDAAPRGRLNYLFVMSQFQKSCRQL